MTGEFGVYAKGSYLRGVGGLSHDQRLDRTSSP